MTGVVSSMDRMVAQLTPAPPMRKGKLTQIGKNGQAGLAQPLREVTDERRVVLRSS